MINLFLVNTSSRAQWNAAFGPQAHIYGGSEYMVPLYTGAGTHRVDLTERPRTERRHFRRAKCGCADVRILERVRVKIMDLD